MTRIVQRVGRIAGIGGFAAVLAVAAVVVSPDRADAHGIGGIRPTNYETRVLSVRPQVPGIEVHAVDLGDRLELRNTTGTDVVVVGYDDEPYLRIGPQGVFENRRSPAVYLNRTRTRSASAPVPKRADPSAPPEWRKVSDDTTARWHDHRAHWMGNGDAPVVEADPGATHLVQRFEVPLRRDGLPTIAVRGDVRWVPGPSPWPWVGLAVALAFLLVLLSRTRFAVSAVGTTLAVVVVSETVHLVGGWGGTTAGTGTKLAASLYAIGGVVVAVLALVWLVRRGLSSAAPLVLIAGLFLALAGGLADITVLTRSQIPTTLAPAIGPADGDPRARPRPRPRRGGCAAPPAASAAGPGDRATNPQCRLARRTVHGSAVVALELERRVRDPEPLDEHLLQRVTAHLGLVQRGLAREHHVRREGRRLRTRVTTGARGAPPPPPTLSTSAPSTSSMCRPAGTPSSRTRPTSRSSTSAEITTRPAMNSEITGSTQSAPNSTTAAPATSAPSEPSASPTRCQKAPRRLRFAACGPAR